MGFPEHRLRRLRGTPQLRGMVRETHLAVDHLVMPIFVRPGEQQKSPIPSMPGIFQLSVDLAVEEAKEARNAGAPAVLLFGIPGEKDPRATEAYDPNGVVQEAVQEIKERVADLVVITDVCLCAYMNHGHCGVVEQHGDRFDVLNDLTLDLIGQTAVSHAKAGADLVAPSGMMDGMVRKIREALDENGFERVPILSYAAKYASAFYGPFRDAAESPPQFGDRSTYQMDPGNRREALREVALDLEEGADIVMVKPALAYLDVIREVRDRFDAPVAAYNVSGEFSMVKAAAANGWIDERATALEILRAIRRAGADIVITYWAKDAARWLRS